MPEVSSAIKFVEGLPATPPRSGSLLQRLADAVGCSVAAFSDAASDGMDQTSELPCLWAGIETVEDRVTVLAFIETLVTGCQPG